MDFPSLWEYFVGFFIGFGGEFDLRHGKFNKSSQAELFQQIPQQNLK
jgi:hypothetical protein